MITRFIEATNGPQNWGKFMVGRFTDEEWQRRSVVSNYYQSGWPTLLSAVGWSKPHVLVLDLQTGEGAIVCPGGSAPADLNKHQIWVCPLFEPFLTWLYKQDLLDLEKLPAHVDLPDAPFAMQGYRRNRNATR